MYLEGGAEPDFPWDVMLDSIEERRVIPIVGPELLTMDIDGRQVPLHRHLAERLAAAFRIDASTLPQGFTLNDVASRFLEARGHRSMLYSTVFSILNERADLLPPTPLLKLARITDFNLFVTTTPDRYLAAAIDLVRFGGAPRTQRCVYSPKKRTQDLPAEASELRDPVVFHIFGSASTVADYVVTDEDLLEFMHAIQTRGDRPELMFDAFRKNHILLIGCSFPDWLFRFFLRVVTNSRLIDPRDNLEIVADDRTPRDPDLVYFLSQCRVQVLPTGGTTAFVDELVGRWEERAARRAGAVQVTTAIRPAQQDGPAVSKMPRGAVFISYANEDRESAKRLHDTLDEAGIDVWYDERRLTAGDEYARIIEGNVSQCSLFLAVLSRNACKRLEGYFRREWWLAFERAKAIDPTYPFLQPAIVDDMVNTDPDIPIEFRRRTIGSCPGGAPAQDFVDSVRKAYRTFRKGES